MHFSSNKYSNHITNFGKQKAKMCIPKPLKQPAIKHAFYFIWSFPSVCICYRLAIIRISHIASILHNDHQNHQDHSLEGQSSTPDRGTRSHISCCPSLPILPLPGHAPEWLWQLPERKYRREVLNKPRGFTMAHILSKVKQVTQLKVLLFVPRL